MKTPLFLPVIVLAAALFSPAAEARAVGPSIRFGGPAVEAALQRAALSFFPPERVGLLYDIVLEERNELYGEDIEFERYTARRNDSVAGSFVRLKVFGAGNTLIDLALLYNGGRISKVVELRIPMVDGQAVPGLGRCLEAIGDWNAAEASAPMASLFEGLSYAARMGDGGSSGPRLDDEQAERLAEGFLADAPKRGSKAPDVEFVTGDGRRLDTRSLAGRPFVVVLASPDEEAGRYMLTSVRKCLAGKKINVFEVLVDTDESLLRACGMQGFDPSPDTVLDPDGKIFEAFAPPLDPYLLCYGADGRLKSGSHGRPYERLAGIVAAYLKEVGAR